MKIDRSNYGMWIIDWLDGNLNSSQIAQLKLFLDGNPDLSEEFRDMPPLSLIPSDITFPDKTHLKKSPSELSASQFDFLCTAFLENDLTHSQKTELREIIDKDPDKKKTFDLIHKTRLIPNSLTYSNRNRLLRLTSLQKLKRVAVTGLSAAATIAIVIMTYKEIERKPSYSNTNKVQTSVIDIILPQPSIAVPSERMIADNNPLPAIQKSVSRFAGAAKENQALIKSDPVKDPMNDTLIRHFENKEMTVNKVPVYSQVFVKKDFISNTLISSNLIQLIPGNEDERSRIGRFFSKAFRERILREKNASDGPLKGYEIAEAGVTGLNELLGWQMTLDKKNDENGELKSICFSSKILKFNAPVKKSEPLQ